MKKIFLISVLMLLSIAVFGQDAKYILGVIRNLAILYTKGNEANAEWEYYSNIYATNFEHKIDTFYTTDRVAQQTSENTATIKEVTKISKIVDSKTFLWHMGSYYKVIITEGEVKNIFYVDYDGAISKNKPEEKVFKCTYQKEEDGKVIVTYGGNEGNDLKMQITIENEECFLSLLHNDLKSLALTIDNIKPYGKKINTKYGGTYYGKIYTGCSVYYKSSIKNTKEKDFHFLNTDECSRMLLWKINLKEKDTQKKKKKRHSEKIDDLYF